METLQYVVFAYRDITSKWPKSIEQVIDEGYIAENSVANVGIIRWVRTALYYNVWNTIYDVTPISG